MVKLLGVKLTGNKWFFGILSFIVIISYLHYVQKYSLNLPLWDDYDSGLDFLLQWKAASGFHDKWQLLLQQHNEHRIVLVKVLEISSYQIFGQINFKYLIWCGNIFLFLIVYLISLLIIPLLADNKQKMPMLLIILSILLCTIQWEAQLWGLAGIETFGQIFCSLWILFLFSKYIEMPRKQTLFLFMLLNFLNMFIGGGFVALFMTLPIIAFIFKKLRLSLFLLIYFSFLSLIYFKISPYQFIAHSTPSVKAGSMFFFTFLGSGFRSVWFKSLGNYMPFLIGIILFLISFFYRKELKENKFIFCWVVFAVITGLLLVKMRGHSMDEVVVTSRYSPYSLITITLLIYGLLLPRITSGILNVLSIIFFCNYMLCFTHNDIYKRYHVAKESIYYPNIPSAIALYDQAQNEGIYINKHLATLVHNVTPKKND